jgi:two-component system cell cycle sensor histidine kinase/response regulator CckA
VTAPSTSLGTGPSTALGTGPRSFWPWRRDPPITGARAYALAIGATTVAMLATRLGYPFVTRAPFIFLFLSVFVTSRWATERAAYLAVILAVIGGYFVVPVGPFGLRMLAFTVFTIVSIITVHLAGQHHRFVQAIQESEAQFRATWEHAALGAAVVDLKGRVERINPALERILGYPAKDWTWIAFDAFTHPDDVADERALFNELISDETPSYQREQRYKREGGAWIWCRVTASAVRGDDGSVTGALMAIEDVTARRQAEADLRNSEAKLRRAQKMEAVGQLVAGVAHNFNNILTITMGYTDVLIEGARRAGQADTLELDEIKKATARGAVLTRQLLAFSRKKDTQPTRVDLNRAVEELRDLLKRVIREDIILTITLAPTPVPIWIDPHDLEQTLLNLVFNSRDALPRGGNIDIEVSTPKLDADMIPPDVSLPKGECAMIRVRDNGAGMTPDVQGRLFEPFFTTKEVGHGTGLGLAFVYGVVRQHQGFITVDTAPGKGTTFDLYFPLTAAAGAKDQSLAAAPSPSAARPSLMVLLVEDEDAVRVVASKMLERAGYRVVSTSRSVDAIALFEKHANEVSLLVTDVVMPGMRGPALAQQLIERRIDLPVLFMSGYSDQMTDIQSLPGRMAFLAKPFTYDALLGAVDDLLGAGVR